MHNTVAGQIFCCRTYLLLKDIFTVAGQIYCCRTHLLLQETLTVLGQNYCCVAHLLGPDNTTVVGHISCSMTHFRVAMKIPTESVIMIIPSRGEGGGLLVGDHTPLGFLFCDAPNLAVWLWKAPKLTFFFTPNF